MCHEFLCTRFRSRLLFQTCALHTCPFLLACCSSPGLVVVLLSVTSLWTDTRARVSLCLDVRDLPDELMLEEVFRRRRRLRGFPHESLRLWLWHGRFFTSKAGSTDHFHWFMDHIVGLFTSSLDSNTEQLRSLNTFSLWASWRANYSNMTGYVGVTIFALCFLSEC